MRRVVHGFARSSSVRRLVPAGPMSSWTLSASTGRCKPQSMAHRVRRRQPLARQRHGSLNRLALVAPAPTPPVSRSGVPKAFQRRSKGVLDAPHACLEASAAESDFLPGHAADPRALWPAQVERDRPSSLVFFGYSPRRVESGSWSDMPPSPRRVDRGTAVTHSEIAMTSWKPTGQDHQHRQSRLVLDARPEIAMRC